MFIYCFLASGDFCYLLITFANSLDPDQYRQNVGPDLDTGCLKCVPERVFEKVKFDKKSADYNKSIRSSNLVPFQSFLNPFSFIYLLVGLSFFSRFCEQIDILI